MTTARSRAAARLLALAALLACADAPGDPRTDTAAGGAATLGGGPTGGTLIVLADREPDQLNPVTYNSNGAYHAVHLLFRALAMRDSTLSGYQPDLATAWTLEDDTTVVIRLRDDVRWHDGVPVTADDVVFTIERQRDLATASPRQSDVAGVTGVAARDSFTVVVRLARPGLYAVNALLEVVPIPRHLLADVPAAELANAPFSRNPVGNGFYRFVEWTAGQRLTLAVNPDKPDGRAAIDRIILRFLPDMNAAMTDLLTGKGDLLAKLPPDQRQRVEAASDVVLHSGPRVRPAWIAWNTRRPPLDDVRVRRALLMGIDRPALARALFGDAGEAALSPVPTALREHDPQVRVVPYDTAGARRLLAEAGWQDTDRDGLLDRGGRPLRLEVDFISTDPARRDMLVAVQSMLRRIGVDLAPRAFESTAWVARLREGGFTGSFWGWGWGPGVMGSNAAMIFHSRSVPPAGPNFAALRDGDIDRLIDRVNVTTDTAEARRLWRELEQRLIDAAVYAPIYMDPELFAVHARFRNVRFRGIEWSEDVPYWYVAPEDRLPRDRAR